MKTSANHNTNFAKIKAQVSQQRHDYEVVVSILQKTDRTQKDLEMLHNKISMLDGFHMFLENYFHGSDITEQIKLCGELAYEKKNKGEIIFEQGEPSNNKLYIILNGSCHLFLLKDLDFQEDPEFEQKLKEQRLSQDKMIGSVSNTIINKLKQMGNKYKHQFQLDFNEKNLTPVEINQLKTRYGKTTRLIEAGSIFGERAIITSQPRTATIVADSHPTELIVLDRDKFLPALEELKRKSQLRRDILFQIFKDMDNYSSARLESMLYSFQVINFTRGHLITEQDVIDDRFYIIAEGDAQIQRKILIPTGKNGKKEEKIAKLSIIGPGVMVGDEIMLNQSGGDTAYTYTAEIISLKASLLVADKKIIERKFPKDLRDYLRNQSIFREKARKVLLENKTLELLKEALKRPSVALSDEFYNNQSIMNHKPNVPSSTDYHQNHSHNPHSQQQQSHSNSELAFNIREKVFDFGDGKNVENAERIDRIFRVKHRINANSISYNHNTNGSSNNNNNHNNSTLSSSSHTGPKSQSQKIYLKHTSKHHRDIFTMIPDQSQFYEHSSYLNPRPLLAQQKANEHLKLTQSLETLPLIPPAANQNQQPRTIVMLSPRTNSISLPVKKSLMIGNNNNNGFSLPQTDKAVLRKRRPSKSTNSFLTATTATHSSTHIEQYPIPTTTMTTSLPLNTKPQQQNQQLHRKKMSNSSSQQSIFQLPRNPDETTPYIHFSPPQQAMTSSSGKQFKTLPIREISCMNSESTDTSNANDTAQSVLPVTIKGISPKHQGIKLQQTQTLSNQSSSSSITVKTKRDQFVDKSKLKLASSTFHDNHQFTDRDETGKSHQQLLYPPIHNEDHNAQYSSKNNNLLDQYFHIKTYRHFKQPQ